MRKSSSPVYQRVHEILVLIIFVNPFPAIRDNCRLLSRLMMFFDSLYCKQSGIKVFASMTKVVLSAIEYLQQT